MSEPAESVNPEFERVRLARVETYEVQYQQSSIELEGLCRIAARICAVPMVGVSWIGRSGQWFQSSFGLPTGIMSEGNFPCTEVVYTGKVLLIEDLELSARWAGTSMTQHGVRAYFGFPLKDSTGTLLGSFCALDTKARQISAEQEIQMQDLAQLASQQIERGRDLYQLEQELKSHENLANLGLVTAGLVHEISNPLTALVHRTELAIEGFETKDPETSEHLKRIGLLTQRVLRIMQAVRGLAEVQAPELQELETLRVMDVVGDFMSMIQSEMTSRGISFYFDVNSSHQVFGNSTMVIQILLNLFNNAAAALDSDPTSEKWVEISTRSRDDGSVDIRFRDSGPGISKEVRKRLTEAFYSTKKGHGGMGVGLNLCRAFARQMQGELSLDTLDDRTTFVLKLKEA